MFLNADQRLAERISSFYSDPLGYVMFNWPWDSEPQIQKAKLIEPWRSRFNCEYGPDVWACEFLDQLGEEIKKRAFDGNHAVPPISFSTASGHGIGKSALVAWLIKFILDTRPRSKGIVTANTAEQLKTKTWAELAKWHSMALTSHWFNYSSSRGNMALYKNSPDKDLMANWRCDAQTCREENAEAFQGLHCVNSTAFYIFDEASGIPDKIWESRMGGMTDGEPMTFDFGNPTRKSGYFFENTVGMRRHRHITRSIDSRSVQITNKALFEEWASDWGEDSDFFKVRVKGEFPSAASVQFIPDDYVNSAMMRNAIQNKSDPLIIGVDVARFGDNSTVIYPRIGYDARSFGYRQYKGLDGYQVAEKVIEVINQFGALGRRVDALFLDGGGLGASPLDFLRNFGYNPIDVNFGRKASEHKYALKGDEMWGRMRDALQTQLALPQSMELKHQLIQREYGFTTSGSKIKLESKKDMEERGCASPDIADALALTFAADVALADASRHIEHQRTNVLSDWDPLNYKVA